MSNLLEICSELPIRNVAKGETVLHQDGKDGEILFLKNGTVEIRVGDSPVTTVSNPGAVLGEIAVLLDRGHSATVVAMKDCEFYVMSDAAEKLPEHPEINREISRSLARRLARASESVAELTRQVEFENDMNDFEMMMLWEEEAEWGDE